MSHFTYVCRMSFAAYQAGNLCQMRTLLPPKDKVLMYGDYNSKVVILDEDDIATYTIKTIDDPRTLNKTLVSLSEQDFLASIKGMDYANQVGAGHYHAMYYEGCLTNFEIGEEGEEASNLYPEVNCTRMDEFLKLYICMRA
ncbi:hypothetical protein ACLB2K_071422 [Fragaria x ananassa]